MTAAFAVAGCDLRDDVMQPAARPDLADPGSALVLQAARNRPGVTVRGASLTVDVTGDIDRQSGMRYYTHAGETALAAVASRIDLDAAGRATGGLVNSDPVVFGFCMYRTSAARMFADGLAHRAAPASFAPSGRTEYAGRSVGVYTDPDGAVAFFSAKVTLVLAADGAVTGTLAEVTDTDTDGEPVKTAHGDPVVTLTAPPAAGWFVEGAAALTSTTSSSPTAAGKWGAQLYGPGGASVGGTWGVTDGATISVMGSFSAQTVGPQRSSRR